MHYVSVPFRNRTTGAEERRNKYVVILRGGPTADAEPDVTYLIASSDRRLPGQQLRSFEVSLGPAEGFHHETLIDCRWVYTVPRREVPVGSFRFQLPEVTMDVVNIALIRGLQMSPPRRPATAPLPQS